MSISVLLFTTALPEPLPTQIKDLANSEQNAHKAGNHHEHGEDLLLCRSVGQHKSGKVRLQG